MKKLIIIVIAFMRVATFCSCTKSTPDWIYARGGSKSDKTGDFNEDTKDTIIRKRLQSVKDSSNNGSFTLVEYSYDANGLVSTVKKSVTDKTDPTKNVENNVRTYLRNPDGTVREVVHTLAGQLKGRYLFTYIGNKVARITGYDPNNQVMMTHSFLYYHNYSGLMSQRIDTLFENGLAKNGRTYKWEYNPDSTISKESGITDNLNPEAPVTYYIEHKVSGWASRGNYLEDFGLPLDFDFFPFPPEIPGVKSREASYKINANKEFDFDKTLRILKKKEMNINGLPNRIEWTTSGGNIDLWTIFTF